jgi:hypothetical protein
MSDIGVEFLKKALIWENFYKAFKKDALNRAF